MSAASPCRTGRLIPLKQLKRSVRRAVFVVAAKFLITEPKNILIKLEKQNCLKLKLRSGTATAVFY